MSRSQRLSFLAVAAVIAVVAVVALAGGSEDGAGDEGAATPAATATATATPESGGMADAGEETPSPTATPEPAADPGPLLRPGGERTTVRARQGEPVRFRIRSPVAEEMHLHGYDITRELPAGQTVTVTIRDPQLTGIYEIELHGSGERIGSLRVDP